MKKMLCFDMDGSIADLYGVPGWLAYLREYSTVPFMIAEPMWDMRTLRSLLLRLRDQGWEIRVITWLSKESTPAYDRAVREAKRMWLTRYEFPVDHFHGIRYGATKADSVRGLTDYAILIDDNVKVRQGWSLGATIDPTMCNLLAELEKLLEGN